MSVYNGFGTREQEYKYNNYLTKMLLLLEKRILWTMKNEKFDEDKWSNTFEKLYKNLALMEKAKYLPPKFSQYLNELAGHLEIKTIEAIDKSEIVSKNSSRSLSKTKNTPETQILLPMSKYASSNSPIKEERPSFMSSNSRSATKDTDQTMILDPKNTTASFNIRKLVNALNYLPHQTISAQIFVTQKQRIDLSNNKNGILLNAKPNQKLSREMSEMETMDERSLRIDNMRRFAADGDATRIPNIDHPNISYASSMERKFPNRTSVGSFISNLNDRPFHSNLKNRPIFTNHSPNNPNRAAIDAFFVAQGYYSEEKTTTTPSIVLKPVLTSKSPNKIYPSGERRDRRSGGGGGEANRDGDELKEKRALRSLLSIDSTSLQQQQYQQQYYQQNVNLTDMSKNCQKALSQANP